MEVVLWLGLLRQVLSTLAGLFFSEVAAELALIQEPPQRRPVLVALPEAVVVVRLLWRELPLHLAPAVMALLRSFGRKGTDMKRAWIEHNRIRDCVTGNPDELFCAEVAAHYATEVPDDAANGDGWVDGQLVKPEPPPPPTPTEQNYPQVSPVQFKLLFTASERVAIKSARASDAVIDDFYDIVEDPRLTFVDLGLQSTKEAIGYLQSKGLITEERAAAILTGVLV